MILRHKSAPLIFGSVVIVGLVAAVTMYRSSPGELTKAHHAVAGSSFIMDCNKCHAEQSVTPGCLTCHSEIKRQLDTQRGYHHWIGGQGKSECAVCHSEHNGPDFKMINEKSWGEKGETGFKHDYLTFNLKGAHDKLACKDCHQKKFTPAFSLPKFKAMKRETSYIGLKQDCVACHKDPHAGGLAAHCAKCHGQAAWKPTVGFNHDRWFPLRAGHAKLDCRKCHAVDHHASGARMKPAFPFERVTGKSCQDCHSNPHRTKFTATCVTCHKVDDPGWKAADARTTPAQHALTGFRLSVPHDKARCLDCHGPDMPGIPYKARYPDPRSPGYNRGEKSCEGCHKDEHRGQFLKNHPRCMDCHTRTAFRPATYGIKDHNTYPLVGGHLKPLCNACHIKDPQTRVRQYVPTPKACAVCHKDAHYGQFRKDDGTTRCEDCHRSTVLWSKLVFNHNTQSRFKLDKAHEKVACKECHPRVTVKGIQLIQYKPIRMQCRDCHDFDH